MMLHHMHQYVHDANDDIAIDLTSTDYYRMLNKQKQELLDLSGKVIKHGQIFRLTAKRLPKISWSQVVHQFEIFVNFMDEFDNKFREYKHAQHRHH